MRILVEPSDYVLRNAGDMAMLEAAVTRLADLWPDGTVDVLTDTPASFPRYRPNVRPIGSAGHHAYVDAAGSRPHLSRLGTRVPGVRRAWRNALVAWRCPASARARAQEFLRAVGDADVVVVTGMGGITDAFPEYAQGVLATLDVAAGLGPVTAMFSQGMGPLERRDLIAYARAVLPRVDLIALREQRTGMPLLQRLGVRAEHVVTTGDDAIEMAYHRRLPALGDTLGINLRAAEYAGIGDELVAEVRSGLQAFAKRRGIRLVPVPISYATGEEDHRTIRSLLAGWDHASDGGAGLVGPEAVIAQIGRCRAVVTGSYHAGVFALGAGVPVVALARTLYYVDKFLGLADQFGAGCEVVTLDGGGIRQRLGAALDHVWDRAETLRPGLLRAAQRQIEQGAAAYRRLHQLVASRGATEGRRG